MKGTRVTFWMVYLAGSLGPQEKFLSFEEAKKDAERLARQTDKDVYLLQATRYVTTSKPAEPPLTWLETCPKKE